MASLIVRKNVESLSPPELQVLRDAYAQAQRDAETMLDELINLEADAFQKAAVGTVSTRVAVSVCLLPS